MSLSGLTHFIDVTCVDCLQKMTTHGGPRGNTTTRRRVRERVTDTLHVTATTLTHTHFISRRPHPHMVNSSILSSSSLLWRYRRRGRRHARSHDTFIYADTVNSTHNNRHTCPPIAIGFHPLSPLLPSKRESSHTAAAPTRYRIYVTRRRLFSCRHCGVGSMTWRHRGWKDIQVVRVRHEWAICLWRVANLWCSTILLRCSDSSVAAFCNQTQTLDRILIWFYLGLINYAGYIYP